MTPDNEKFEFWLMPVSEVEDGINAKVTIIDSENGNTVLSIPVRGKSWNHLIEIAESIKTVFLRGY